MLRIFYRKPPNGRICLADLINRAKFYLNQIRGFDSAGGVKFLAFLQERDVAVNTGLELPFSL